MRPPTYVEGFHDTDAVDRMTYHPLGGTGLQVSRLSLGGGPFGGLYGSVTEQEGIDTVHLALKSGVNYIDTAPWYGGGRSEEVLGKALKNIPRKSYYIGTKVGRYDPDPERMFDFSAERVSESVEQSLRLLNLDYVDVVNIHDVEFAENLDIIVKETLPALQKVVDQGKARFIGITGYPVSTLKEVIERSRVKVDVVLTYARNTLFDDTLAEFMPFFKSRGVGVICGSAMAMGMLCDGPIPSWHWAHQEVKDASREALRYCKEEGVDLGRLAVQHAGRLEGVATLLIGNNNKDILRRNLDNVLTPATPLEEEVSRMVRKKFFEPLKKKHWEGVEVASYWAKLKQRREKAEDTK